MNSPESSETVGSVFASSARRTILSVIPMASPPSHHDRRSADSSPSGDRRDDEHGALERAAPELASPIRAAGFWAAIAMPFLYVPLLATGLSSSLDGMLFLGLLVGNLLALYVGHAHRR